MPNTSIDAQDLLALVGLFSAMGILMVVMVYVLIHLIDEEFL